MGRQGRQTGIHAEGVNQLLRTMSRMGKDISDHARTGSLDIAERFLRHVRGATSTVPESRAASILKVYRDRVPKVGFPAGTRVPVSGNPKIGEFFYGVEWGGRRTSSTMQFPAPNRDGHFFYPTLSLRGPGYAVEWFDLVMDEMSEDWNAGALRAQR